MYVCTYYIYVCVYLSNYFFVIFLSIYLIYLSIYPYVYHLSLFADEVQIWRKNYTQRHTYSLASRDSRISLGKLTLRFTHFYNYIYIHIRCKLSKQLGIELLKITVIKYRNTFAHTFRFKYVQYVYAYEYRQIRRFSVVLLRSSFANFPRSRIFREQIRVVRQELTRAKIKIFGLFVIFWLKSLKGSEIWWNIFYTI